MKFSLQRYITSLTTKSPGGLTSPRTIKTWCHSTTSHPFLLGYPSFAPQLMQDGCQGLYLLFHPFHPVEHDFFPCFTGYLPQRHGIVKPHITPLCTTSSCLHCFSLASLFFLLSTETFCSNPHRRRQNVDARFWLSAFYDQGLCSINFTTTRISPRKASSPEVHAFTEVGQSTPVVFPA